MANEKTKISLNDKVEGSPLSWMKGKIITITGSFEGIEWVTIKYLISRHGGTYQPHMTKQVDVVLVGKNAGCKVKLAEKFAAATISSSDFLKMVLCFLERMIGLPTNEIPEPGELVSVEIPHYLCRSCVYFEGDLPDYGESCVYNPDIKPRPGGLAACSKIKLKLRELRGSKKRKGETIWQTR